MVLTRWAMMMTAASSWHPLKHGGELRLSLRPERKNCRQRYKQRLFLPVPWRWKGAASVRLKNSCPPELYGKPGHPAGHIQSPPELYLELSAAPPPRRWDFHTAGFLQWCRKRARLSGYIRYCVTKLFLGKFPDIGSIQTNPSGGNIVKAQNQLCNGGFSASRTADNGSCSAFLTLKGR